MDDLAQQIRAWADAAAETAGEPVSAVEVRSNDHQRHPKRRRSATGQSSTRHVVLVAAATLVVVAAVVTIVAVTRHDRSTTTLSVKRPSTTERTENTGPTAAGDRIPLHLLAVHPAVLDQTGTLRSAKTSQELAGLWADAGLSSHVPTIDFHNQVVVSITIPTNACPPTLDGFDRRGSTLQPRFTQVRVACRQLGIWRTYVAALDWKTTGPAFQLRLPGQPQYRFSDTFIDIQERPASTIYDASGLQDDLRQRFAHTVVGVYYDKTTLVVTVTADADHPAIQDEIERYDRRQPSSSPAVRLEVVANRRSRLDELMAKELRLDRTILKRGADVNSVGIDMIGATLHIGLQQDTAHARAVVLDVLGAAPTEVSFSQQDVVPALGAPVPTTGGSP